MLLSAACHGSWVLKAQAKRIVHQTGRLRLCRRLPYNLCGWHLAGANCVIEHRTSEVQLQTSNGLPKCINHTLGRPTV